MGDAILEALVSPHRDAVDVRYRSFELMPELPADSTTSPTSCWQPGGGSPRTGRADARTGDGSGRRTGLDYRFDRALTTNTTAAHRLSHFAAAHGPPARDGSAVFRAYFTDGPQHRRLRRSSSRTLPPKSDWIAQSALAALAGGELPMKSRRTSRCHASLESAAFRSSGVFNGKPAVSGAQPVEAFLQVLDTAWKNISGRLPLARP